MQHRYMRLFGLVAAALFLSSALAQTNLNFWSWRTEDVDAYNSFIAEFEAANPDITVTFTPYQNTEYNTILSTALQGGGGPDIVHLRAYGGIEPLAEAGLIERLDGQVAALEDFDAGILLGATNREDGGIYGVPFAIQVIPVLYNVGIFELLGLSEPQTWDELIAVAAALQEAGYYAFANGSSEPWTLETMFGGMAPAFYGGDDYFNALVAGETDFHDARMVEALDRMLELRPYLAPNHQGVNYSDMQTSFAFEMAGMLIGGSYELGTMASLNPDLRIGSFPFPNDDGPGPVSVYVDGSYGISSSTPHQAEALRFIEFLATQEFGQMFTDTLQQISAVPGVTPSGQELSDIVSLVDTDSTPFLFLTAFRFGQPSGSTLLQNELQAAMGDTKSVDEVLAVIQQGIATWHPAFSE